MDYKYDVFLSYKRSTTIVEWIEEIFFEKFSDYLNNALAESGRSAKIFRDTNSIEPGDKWPDELKLALSSSRSMFALLSPEYIGDLNGVLVSFQV